MSTSAHSGSDHNTHSGRVNLYHILPMSRKAEKKLFQHGNINSRIYGEYNETLVIRRIRAKQLETRLNMERQTSAMPDQWHVLVDNNGKKQGKFKAMSFAEAVRRNVTIKELGLQWTRGEP